MVSGSSLETRGTGEKDYYNMDTHKKITPNTLAPSYFETLAGDE